MLQYFAAVPQQAENVSGPQRPVGAAQTAAVGPPGRGRGNGAFGENGQQAPEEAAARRFLRSPLAPSRRAAARPPKVSGTPPWEPAPKPDTELPWAASPPPALPKRAPVPLPAPAAPPAESLWARAAASAAPVVENGKADSAADAAEPGIRPIYVWNPGANTETFDTFPSVPSRGPAAEPGQPESGQSSAGAEDWPEPADWPEPKDWPQPED